MHRIDGTSAAPTIPAPRAQGTPGYFTDGDPTTGKEATIVTADWANALQEELAYVIERAAITLNKSDRTQLFQALGKLTRVRLTAPATFYVSPTGNDLNDGLTPQSPFATINRAYTWIRDRIDCNGYQTTIQLANGTHPGASVLYPVSNGPAPVIVGNASDPSTVVINNPTGPAISANDGAFVLVDSVTLTATNGSGGAGVGLVASGSAQIYFDRVRFGVCQQAHIWSSFGGLVGAVSLFGNPITWTIAGGAPICIYVTGGYATIVNSTVQLLGTPNFPSGFVNAQAGASLVQAYGCAFNGAATGPKYIVSLNAVIQTAGAGVSYLPGNAAGSALTGGQYA